ncbi:RNA polymerase subunit sigma [Thioclava sediminum]|uniref:RNA polymerase sigma factor n=1 Tax=Thioclava sediminum TaxID=1915319 RepID=A0ABX3MTG8_9RHOB|nr:RNA polymerase subunit sigma [Thioclava sp. DLFJ5-1]OOY22992.1 RNA polymerase subunit sigma [Thioclava sediminum]
MLRDATINFDTTGTPPIAAGQAFAGKIMDDRKSAKPTPEAACEQTDWLVAVRDKRDKLAFARLYDHFSPRLKGMLVRSGMTQAAAEDVVQDVMLTIWRKAHLYDETRARASAWIYRIARNRQIDVIRRRPRPVPDELIAEAETRETREADAAIGLEQEAAQLREAIEALPEAQREIIERAYVGELTQAEIREATGLALGTIKSRIRLALEKLRHELRDLREE